MMIGVAGDDFLKINPDLLAKKPRHVIGSAGPPLERVLWGNFWQFLGIAPY